MASASINHDRIVVMMSKSPEIIEFDPITEPLFCEFPLSHTFTKAGHWELLPEDCGGKSKHTIKFVSNGTCDTREQFVYMIVVDDRIAKIGGSKNSVKSRIQSYNCGVYSRWRGGNGKQSVTNSVIYDSIEMCLLKNHKVELYVYFIDIPKVAVKCWEIETRTICPTIYDVYETCAIRNFYNIYGKNPKWSKNGRK